MNKKYYFVFIVKNISCIQFLSCHTSNEKFLTLNFSQTTVASYIIKVLKIILYKHGDYIDHFVVTFL